MNNLLRFLSPSLCLVLTLTGCDSVTSTNPAPIPFNVTRNWQFDLQIPLPPTTEPIVLPTNPLENVCGSLNSSGTSVSAVLHATPLALPNGVQMETDLPFSGTTDNSGNLTLTAPLVFIKSLPQ